VADDPDDDVITKAFTKMVEDAVERGMDSHTLENAAMVAFQQSADHLRDELKSRRCPRPASRRSLAHPVRPPPGRVAHGAG
jgi:hypothetical protein